MIKAKLTESLTEDSIEVVFPNMPEVDMKNPFFTPDLIEVTGDMNGQSRVAVRSWIRALHEHCGIEESNKIINLNHGKLGEPVDEETRINPIMKFFDTEHLPEELQPISGRVGVLAAKMDQQLPDCAEKSAGLRKLLEAKDCFVRAYLEKK